MEKEKKKVEDDFKKCRCCGIRCCVDMYSVVIEHPPYGRTEHHWYARCLCGARTYNTDTRKDAKDAWQRINTDPAAESEE